MATKTYRDPAGVAFPAPHPTTPLPLKLVGLCLDRHRLQEQWQQLPTSRVGSKVKMRAHINAERARVRRTLMQALDQNAFAIASACMEYRSHVCLLDPAFGPLLQTRARAMREVFATTSLKKRVEVRETAEVLQLGERTNAIAHVAARRAIDDSTTEICEHLAQLLQRDQSQLALDTKAPTT